MSTVRRTRAYMRCNYAIQLAYSSRSSSNSSCLRLPYGQKRVAHPPWVAQVTRPASRARVAHMKSTSTAFSRLSVYRGPSTCS